jgi:hypothetical protein
MFYDVGQGGLSGTGYDISTMSDLIPNPILKLS